MGLPPRTYEQGAVEGGVLLKQSTDRSKLFKRSPRFLPPPHASLLCWGCSWGGYPQLQHCALSPPAQPSHLRARYWHSPSLSPLPPKRRSAAVCTPPCPSDASRSADLLLRFSPAVAVASCTSPFYGAFALKKLAIVTLLRKYGVKVRMCVWIQSCHGY